MSASPTMAHDLGAKGNKATLYDAEGSWRARSFCGYCKNYPRLDWVEQNAFEPLLEGLARV